MFTMNPAGPLVKRLNMNPGSAGTRVYFSCADCSAEAARPAALVGTELQAKTSIGEYGYIETARYRRQHHRTALP